MGVVLEPEGFEYEAHQLSYIVPRKYIPDYSLGETHIEVKGYFRAGDTQKYKAIKDSLEAIGHQLVFVLQTPSKKVRKGGVLTMADWCNKNDIPWYTPAELDQLLIDLIEYEYVDQEDDDEDDF